MKKLIFIVTTMVMSFGVAKAQDFTYGPKIGINFANLTNTGGDGNFKPGLFIGGFAEWRLGNIVAVSPELYYSRQGMSESEDGAKVRLRFNYINLPVLAKLYLTDNLSLDLGPQFGCMFSPKVWVKAGGTKAVIDFDDFEGANDQINSVDVSFAAGLSYNYGPFVGSLRWNIGLTEVIKETDAKNSVIQLGVGYRF